jgi:UDP-N-acetylmuramate: L-alanyl-gamma-D-glutamyl-meso-diaminopimelate ligase
MLSADAEASGALAASAASRITTVGTSSRADRIVSDVTLASHGSFFSLDDVRFFLPMHGVMNVRNAAMALAVAEAFGVPPVEAVAAVAAFAGIVDRQDAIEAGGCVVVRDKASHPHSLQELGAALRQRYPGRRLVSVMQPRATGGRGWIYQRELPAALAAFDAVILTHPYEHKPPGDAAWKADPFCLDALAAALCAIGADVQVVTTLADLPEAVRRSAAPGDVVLLSLREQFASSVDMIEEALGADRARARPTRISTP